MCPHDRYVRDQGLYSMKDAEINSAGRPFMYEPIKQRVTKNVNSSATPA